MMQRLVKKKQADTKHSAWFSPVCHRVFGPILLIFFLLQNGLKLLSFLLLSFHLVHFD